MYEDKITPYKTFKNAQLSKTNMRKTILRNIYSMKNIMSMKIYFLYDLSAGNFNLQEYIKISPFSSFVLSK